MLIRFPDRCAKCGKPGHDAEWPISRLEKGGGYETTYSIKVPVCRDCKTELSRLSATSWMIGIIVGVLVCLGLRSTDLWSQPSGFFGWVGPIFIGLVALSLGYFIVGWITGLFFARISRGGGKLHFSNADYQREFDLMN